MTIIATKILVSSVNPDFRFNDRWIDKSELTMYETLVNSGDMPLALSRNVFASLRSAPRERGYYYFAGYSSHGRFHGALFSREARRGSPAWMVREVCNVARAKEVRIKDILRAQEYMFPLASIE